MASHPTFITKLIEVIKDTSKDKKIYLNCLDCLCRIAKHSTFDPFRPVDETHPLHAFTPLLGRLDCLANPAEESDFLTDLREASQANDSTVSSEVQLERRLILTSLVYLLKKIPYGQFSDDMTKRAPVLLSLLFHSFTDRRPGKRIETTQSMWTKLGTENRPFLWLSRLHRWGTTSSMPTVEHQELPRLLFKRKDGATDIINLLIDCITAGLQSA